MIKQHLSFNIPDHINATIWRYSSIEKLESLFEKKALYFCRADLLGDEYEGSYSDPTIQKRPIFYEGASKHFLETGLSEMSKSFRLCTYINCWHVNSEESIAMWKFYSKDYKSTAIKSSINSLKLSILDTQREFCLGFINYINYKKQYMSEANGFIPFFHKQKAYEHEKEFRIIADELDKIGEIQNGKLKPLKGLFIEIDVKLLIHSIIISPYANADFERKVRELLNNYKLADKLIKSDLLRPPKF